MYSISTMDTSSLQPRLAPLKGKWSRIAREARVAPQTIFRIAWGEERDHRIGTYRRISRAIECVELEMATKR